MTDDNGIKYDEVDMGDEGVVAELDPTTDQSSVENFINSIEKQDYNAAEAEFKDLVGQRLQTAFDQTKVKVASEIYADDAEEEPEIEEDDVETAED